MRWIERTTGHHVAALFSGWMCSSSEEGCTMKVFQWVVSGGPVCALMFVVLAGCTTKIEEHRTVEREKESVGPRVGHEAYDGDRRAIGVEVDRRYEATGDGGQQGDRSKESSPKTSAPAEPEKKSVEKTPDVKKPDVKKSL